MSAGKINPQITPRKSDIRPPNVNELFNKICEQDMPSLSRAITLMESSLSIHRNWAESLLELAIPKSGKALRIGITGIPGAGKSTLIEALGEGLMLGGHRLAVLAIDPSSRQTGGSILGDKTRMDYLSRNPNAFVRPSPSGNTLGGVTKNTRETLLLCEAAGYDIVIVETVGVGQSEIAVHDMVDIFLMVAIPGAGDELQGIKRGITEMADLIVVNKADGDNASRAAIAAGQLKNALHLFPPHPYGIQPDVLTCSATTTKGIPELTAHIFQLNHSLRESGALYERRKKQLKLWMEESLRHYWLTALEEDPKWSEQKQLLLEKVESGKMNPYTAARELWYLWLGKK
jgi:LAO/AO transport system kinase